MKETVICNPDHICKWDMERLHELGCFLEGLKLGRGGNIHPMGTATIDSLYKAIRTLNGIIHNPKLNPVGTMDKKANERCKECGHFV